MEKPSQVSKIWGVWNGDTCQCCLAAVQNQTKPQTLINVIMQRLGSKELVLLILDVGVHLCRLLWSTFYLCGLGRCVRGKNGFW